MIKETFLSTCITVTLLCQILNVSSGNRSQLINEYVHKPNIETEIETEIDDTMDVFFDDYKTRAQVYLDRDVFIGTPITGKILSACAKTTYDSTGVIVPLELALSQAQLESGMGRKGLSPETNPYNVGEWDQGTMWTFSNTKQGVQAYFNLIAKDYMLNKTLTDLLKNFVNTNGHRYASSTNYETKLTNQCSYIQRWIDNNITT